MKKTTTTYLGFVFHVYTPCIRYIYSVYFMHIHSVYVSNTKGYTLLEREKKSIPYNWANASTAITV